MSLYERMAKVGMPFEQVCSFVCKRTVVPDRVDCACLECNLELTVLPTVEMSQASCKPGLLSDSQRVGRVPYHLEAFIPGVGSAAPGSGFHVAQCLDFKTSQSF